MPTIDPISAVATKKVIEDLLSDMYKLAKTQFGNQFNKWRNQAHISSLYKNLGNVRHVKTILQLEQEVDIMSFYHPSKVKVNNIRRTISDLADFPFEGNLVIQGSVGQGKSIFLRYLVARELAKGQAIPVFFELRRLRSGESLMVQLFEELKALGLELHDDSFDFFASRGKIQLYLDAFDEVKEEFRTGLLNDIENLAKRFESMRIIVTSRLNSGVAHSAFFRVFELCQLEGSEYEQVITRMAVDDNVATSIIQGIRRDRCKVAGLLTTPLMVALLMVRYRIEQTIPQNEIAFYDSLFDLLLQRHDKSKGGFSRPHKSGLGDSALKELFNAICFLTRKADQSTLTIRELQLHAKEAITTLDKNCDTEKAVNDIIDITCLILTDGDECRFIHKSVQEYHAALYIKESPDVVSKIFYTAMQSRWRFWEVTLVFLASIDRYNFLKYFHIPKLREALGMDGVVPNLPLDYDLNLIIRIFGDDVLGRKTDGRVFSYGWASASVFWPISRDFMSYTALTEYHSDFPKDFDVPGAYVAKGESRIQVRDIPFNDSRFASFTKFWKRILGELHRELLDSIAYVDNVERKKSAVGF
jgi:hypothetical protein